MEHVTPWCIFSNLFHCWYISQVMFFFHCFCLWWWRCKFCESIVYNELHLDYLHSACVCLCVSVCVMLFSSFVIDARPEWRANTGLLFLHFFLPWYTHSGIHRKLTVQQNSRPATSFGYIIYNTSNRLTWLAEVSFSPLNASANRMELSMFQIL